MAETSFSLIALDVDGSLANPIMRMAVICWAAAFAAAMAFSLRLIRYGWARVGVSIAFLAASYVGSLHATRAIAMLIYATFSRPGVSVGIMGSPPMFVSPVMTLALLGLAAVVMPLHSAPEQNPEASKDSAAGLNGN
jgi:hypothetical protein